MGASLDWPVCCRVDMRSRPQFLCCARCGIPFVDRQWPQGMDTVEARSYLTGLALATSPFFYSSMALRFRQPQTRVWGVLSCHRLSQMKSKARQPQGALTTQQPYGWRE